MGLKEGMQRYGLLLTDAGTRLAEAPEAKLRRKTAAEKAEHEVVPHLVRLQRGTVIFHEGCELQGTAPKIRQAAIDHRVVRSAGVKCKDE